MLFVVAVVVATLSSIVVAGRGGYLGAIFLVFWPRFKGGIVFCFSPFLVRMKIELDIGPRALCKSRRCGANKKED